MMGRKECHMETILVATDFSDRSDRAIRRGVLLAKMFNASITLLHVIDDQQRRAIHAEQQAANELLVEQTRTIRELDGVNCGAKIVLGDLFEGIVGATQEENIDLLVIGPHRRQALRDVFVGTKAERIIRACDRPILMANGVPTGYYRSILIAVDQSECSANAIRVAQNLGLTETIATSIIHVFNAPALGLMVRTSSTLDQIKDYLADEEERSAAELAKFLAPLNLKPVQRILRHGDVPAAHGILAAARDLSADLIVVGTHGRTGIAKALLGSVAEEVLRTSGNDVLVIPPIGKVC